MRSKHFRYAVSTLAGSSLRNIEVLRNHYRIEPKYRAKFAFTLVVAGLLEIVNPMERLFWGKRIRNHRLTHPPVFIVGFWRSGTTLLHNLLCQDPKAAYTTTFQTVFPNLLLTQSWWMKPIVNLFLPAERPYDNVSMDMDFPQEEDFGMMNMQPSTIYKFFLFPKDYDRIVEEELFTSGLPPDRLEQWRAAYRVMIAKAEFNTGGTRYVGKNPCHLTRIGLLREMFPDAKFIFIHRHPYKVAESLYQFMLRIFPGVQLQDVPADFTREKIVLLYRRMMETYFEDRYLIPPGNLLELGMDDFMGDIHGHLESIYRQLCLGDYEEARPHTEQFLKDSSYQAPVREPAGEEIRRLVDQHASGIMETLGYQKG